jgi:hypothetical protein
MDTLGSRCHLCVALSHWTFQTKSFNLDTSKTFLHPARTCNSLTSSKVRTYTYLALMCDHQSDRARERERVHTCKCPKKSSKYWSAMQCQQASLCQHLTVRSFIGISIKVLLMWESYVHVELWSHFSTGELLRVWKWLFERSRTALTC